MKLICLPFIAHLLVRCQPEVYGYDFTRVYTLPSTITNNQNIGPWNSITTLTGSTSVSTSGTLTASSGIYRIKNSFHVALGGAITVGLAPYFPSQPHVFSSLNNSTGTRSFNLRLAVAPVIATCSNMNILYTWTKYLLANSNPNDPNNKYFENYLINAKVGDRVADSQIDNKSGSNNNILDVIESDQSDFSILYLYRVTAYNTITNKSNYMDCVVPGAQIFNTAASIKDAALWQIHCESKITNFNGQRTATAPSTQATPYTLGPGNGYDNVNSVLKYRYGYLIGLNRIPTLSSYDNAIISGTLQQTNLDNTKFSCDYTPATLGSLYILLPFAVYDNLGVTGDPININTDPTNLTHSLLVAAPGHDTGKWTAGVDWACNEYQVSYLLTPCPGRIWNTAPGASGGYHLKALNSTHYTISKNSSTTLTVIGNPYAPITFAINGPGLFDNNSNVITVKADGNGQASAVYKASAGGDRISILVGSPMAVGQIRFLMEMQP